MTTVYVVGRYLEEGAGWELEVVEATEQAAIAACDEPDLFYVPMVLGERHETSADRRARIQRGEPCVALPVVYPREGA